MFPFVYVACFSVVPGCGCMCMCMVAACAWWLHVHVHVHAHVHVHVHEHVHVHVHVHGCGGTTRHVFYSPNCTLRISLSALRPPHTPLLTLLIFPSRLCYLLGTYIQSHPLLQCVQAALCPRCASPCLSLLRAPNSALRFPVRC